MRRSELDEHRGEAVSAGEQFNIEPQFQRTTVPCEGTAGDLLVLTPLAEGEYDPSPQGLASLWLCTRSSNEGDQVPAVWARVQFDGVASCDRPVPDPPQDRPPLGKG
ncbi:hypothetical protein GT204_02475 [Streptomyces sp. SID4919]|uniref:hypothetical protein n=1 Tax=unclassified Streptomyces TaxID=2593676 RepID=UPI000823BDC5|nr:MULTISPECIES: hypothetical protein [unclassified Streptomyces]MYY07788.1 hypothetical protein [Streptomyces sp. SID4919]SCK05664.1 hypothetical protein YW7DRAFT_00090 [Streptomyces sp. AmelKG-E11A]